MTTSIIINGNIVDDYVLESSEVIPLTARNRDWSLVTNGLQLILSASYPNVVNQGDLVYIYFDTDIRFVGYVACPVINPETSEIEIRIENFLLKLQEKKFTFANLQNFIWNTGTWDTGKTFTVETTYHGIIPIGTMPAVNDRVQFKTEDGGTLPTPLVPFQYYYVKSLNGTTSYNIAATPGGTAIVVNNNSTSTCYYATPDESRYKDYESGGFFGSTYLGYKNVSAQWLIQAILAFMGIDTDVTAFATNIVHRANFTSYITSALDYKLNQLCFDLNEIFCAGQNVATNIDTLTNGDKKIDYSKATPTCFDVLSEIFRRIGINCYWSGNSGNPFKVTLINQKIEDGWATSQDFYTVPDDDTQGLKDAPIYATDESYSYSMQNAGNRSYYNSNAITDLAEQEKVIMNDGATNLTCMSNFVIRLRDIYFHPAEYNIWDNEYDNFMDSRRVFMNDILAMAIVGTNYEITTDYEIAGILPMLSLEWDFVNQQYIIKQDVQA